MGLFDLEDVQASAGGGNYITAGHYFMRIDRVKSGTSQQDGGGDFIAIEATVIDTLPDGDVPLDANFDPKGKEAWHSPGQQVSQLFMEKHGKTAKANYKAFIVNVAGCSEAEVTKERAQSVIDDAKKSGIFAGLFVEVRARTIKTKNAGKPFTKVSWLREVPPAEIKQRVSEEQLSRILGPGKIDALVEAYGA